MAVFAAQSRDLEKMFRTVFPQQRVWIQPGSTETPKIRRKFPGGLSSSRRTLESRRGGRLDVSRLTSGHDSRQLFAPISDCAAGKSSYRLLLRLLILALGLCRGHFGFAQGARIFTSVLFCQ